MRSNYGEVLCGLLKALRASWVTAPEAAKVAGVEAATARAWLRSMRDNGLVRERLRAKPQMDENGNNKPGYKPAEYKLTSKWGGLS